MRRPRVADTPDGSRLEVTGTIAAPAKAAWELLVTPDRWPEWGPSIRAVECVDEQIRAGSTGRVRLPGGLWLPFEIETFTPLSDHSSGRWTWHVARIPATGHRVDSLDGACRVVFELPLLAAGYVPVCSRAIDRIERCLEA